MIYEIRRLDKILFLNESTVKNAVTGQYFEDPLNVKNCSPKRLRKAIVFEKTFEILFIKAEKHCRLLGEYFQKLNGV